MKNEINMSDVWKWAKDLFPLSRSLTFTLNKNNKFRTAVKFEPFN